MTALKNLKTASTHVADDPRWTRIVTRDRSADGEFWYSVVTTGVYCRPSCPSRTANPKNVQLQLASSVGRSPSHFHRLFKATTGLTPKEYADEHRATRIREGLMTSYSVT